MTAFTHLILTRFNVRIRYGKKVGFGAEAAPDAEWLAHRFKLFEDYCLPSVQAQTVQQFKWLVFFDGETPEVYRRRIQMYQAREAFIPHFLSESYQHFMRGSFEKVIRGLVDPSSEYLITTRLDNDDAVSRHFVSSIQEQFEGQDLAFLNFRKGLLLNDRSKKLYLARHDSNPFASVIERVDSFQTILDHYHNRIRFQERVMQIDTRPLWLQVIHGRNVSNRIRFQERVPLRALGSDFAISAGLNPEAENPTALAIENALNRFLRRAATLVRSVPSVQQTSR